MKIQTALKHFDRSSSLAQPMQLYLGFNSLLRVADQKSGRCKPFVNFFRRPFVHFPMKGQIGCGRPVRFGPMKSAHEREQ